VNSFDGHIPPEQQGPFSEIPKGVLMVVLGLVLINKLTKGKYGAATHAGLTYILGLTNRTTVYEQVTKGVELEWLERVDTKPVTVKLGKKTLDKVNEIAKWKNF